MKFKDLLRDFNIGAITNRLLELRPYILEFEPEEQKKYFFKACEIAYKNILNTEVMDNDKSILVCAKQLSYSKDGDDDYEVFTLDKEYCKSGPYTFDGENCIQRYSLLFTPWKEFLGLEICQKSIDLYTSLDVCCIIFHEFIRMGIDDEQRNNRVKEEIDILVDRAENFREEDCIPADEFFKTLRDELVDELEKEGDFEAAEEVRQWEDEEETEEEKEYGLKSIYENQNIYFMFKKYISENY